MLVHSSSSSCDERAIARLADVAHRRGLRRICCVEKATRGTQRVKQLVQAVERARAQSSVTLYAGIRASFADEYGSLDMPDDTAGIDYIYLDDNRFPLGASAYSPEHILAQAREGGLKGSEIIEILLAALNHAMVCQRGLILINPFGLLRKLCISQAELSRHHIERLIVVARATNASLALVEQAPEPIAWMVAECLRADIPVVLGSGGQNPRDVGRYRYCLELWDDMLSINQTLPTT